MMKTLVLAAAMLLIAAAGLQAHAAETALNGTLNISTGQTVHVTLFDQTGTVAVPPSAVSCNWQSAGTTPANVTADATGFNFVYNHAGTMGWSCTDNDGGATGVLTVVGKSTVTSLTFWTP